MNGWIVFSLRIYQVLVSEHNTVPRRARMFSIHAWRGNNIPGQPSKPRIDVNWVINLDIWRYLRAQCQFHRSMSFGIFERTKFNAKVTLIVVKIYNSLDRKVIKRGNELALICLLSAYSHNTPLHCPPVTYPPVNVINPIISDLRKLVHQFNPCPSRRSFNQIRSQLFVI